MLVEETLIVEKAIEDITNKLTEQMHYLEELKQQSKTTKLIYSTVQQEYLEINKESKRLEEKARIFEQKLAALQQQLAKICLSNSMKEPLDLHTSLNQEFSEKMKNFIKVKADLIATREEVWAELLQIEKECHDLSNQWEFVQRQLKDERKTYVVTSLTGGRGQQDPAIFAECTSKGIVIQPEGILLSQGLTPNDQKTFLTYVQKTYYVVFLIRPDGLKNFFQYRRLVFSQNRLEKQTVNIGFEPVNEDWILTYPEKEGSLHAKNT